MCTFTFYSNPYGVIRTRTSPRYKGVCLQTADLNVFFQKTSYKAFILQHINNGPCRPYILPMRRYVKVALFLCPFWKNVFDICLLMIGQLCLSSVLGGADQRSSKENNLNVPGEFCWYWSAFRSQKVFQAICNRQLSFPLYGKIYFRLQSTFFFYEALLYCKSQTKNDHVFCTYMPLYVFKLFGDSTSLCGKQR